LGNGSYAGQILNFQLISVTNVAHWTFNGTLIPGVNGTASYASAPYVFIFQWTGSAWILVNSYTVPSGGAGVFSTYGGYENTAPGQYADVQNYQNAATGQFSTARGSGSIAAGVGSRADGQGSLVCGAFSQGGGEGTVVVGESAVGIGNGGFSSGTGSFSLNGSAGWYPATFTVSGSGPYTVSITGLGVVATQQFVTGTIVEFFNTPPTTPSCLAQTPSSVSYNSGTDTLTFTVTTNVSAYQYAVSLNLSEGALAQGYSTVTVYPNEYGQSNVANVQPGDTQYSRMQLYAFTLDATQTEMTFDEAPPQGTIGGLSNRFIAWNGAGYFIKLRVTGKTSGSANVFSAERNVIMVNNAGTVTVPSVVTVGTDCTNWIANVEFERILNP
jgi:hypothetical protein